MKRMLKRLLRPALALAGMWLLAWFGLPWLVPLPARLEHPPGPGTRYLASDGTPLRQLLDDEGQRSTPQVPLEKLPASLIKATLAAEDRRFYTHGGVDLAAIMRSLSMNLRAGRVLSGASTLTQQLVKISHGPEQRTVWTKMMETLAARHLEMRWTKAQILEAYLNRVSYGNLFTGCQAAADGYLHKPLCDLTPAECAFLAALPQAPGRLNPFRDQEAVTRRSKHVLQRMRELGWLDEETCNVAMAQPLILQRYRGGFVAPHAIDFLKQKAERSAMVRTTIDPKLQIQVETIISHKLQGLRSKRVEHAAAVVIENSTGHVLALAGSRDYFAPDGGQINGAWAPHSPGSALKPFTYALAFERGATPASIATDLPIEFQTPTGLYRPENYDHKVYGPMTYRYALGNSLNISAVRVLRDVGGAPTLLDKLEELGLTTLTEPADHYGLGLTIGNAPVRLLELTNAYA
ncbi:MAG: Penicillin-binding protein, partial [Verrucomicrobiaceae bacterium]|nr:Penicillin-binding protein [Verrucomicrobiaceae bacterium]